MIIALILSLFLIVNQSNAASVFVSQGQNTPKFTGLNVLLEDNTAWLSKFKSNPTKVEVPVVGKITEVKPVKLFTAISNSPPLVSTQSLFKPPPFESLKIVESVPHVKQTAFEFLGGHRGVFNGFEWPTKKQMSAYPIFASSKFTKSDDAVSQTKFINKTTNATSTPAPAHVDPFLTIKAKVPVMIVKVFTIFTSPASINISSNTSFESTVNEVKNLTLGNLLKPFNVSGLIPDMVANLSLPVQTPTVPSFSFPGIFGFVAKKKMEKVVKVKPVMVGLPSQKRTARQFGGGFDQSGFGGGFNQFGGGFGGGGFRGGNNFNNNNAGFGGFGGNNFNNNNAGFDGFGGNNFNNNNGK